MTALADELVELGILAAPEAERSDGEETDEWLARLVANGSLSSFQADEIARGHAPRLRIGGHVLLGELGRGGMGVVYRARHLRMQREVAIKVLAPRLVRDEESVRRFEREVVTAARVQHPNIVTAYDADESAGRHFLVMELVDGDDLMSIVRDRGPLSAEAAVNAVLQAARGLAYAHERGIVHRDVKPANLLRTADGTVKILDMGIARLADGDPLGRTETALTGTNVIMGTVDYMAPEQAESTRRADARSDVYSLGATLFTLLTGRPTYPADSTIGRIVAHRDAPIPSLRDTRADVPQPLDDVFRRMVAKQPEDRPGSMDEVVAALEGLPIQLLDVGTKSNDSLHASTVVRVPDSSEDDTRTLSAGQSTDAGSRTPTIGRTRSAARHPAVAGLLILLGFVSVGYIGYYSSFDPSKNEPFTQDNFLDTPSAAIPGIRMVEPKPEQSEVPPSSPPNQPNLALRLDGVDDFVELPFGYSGSHPLTIEMWVTPDGPFDRSHTIFSNSEGSGAKIDILRTNYAKDPDASGRYTFTVYARDEIEKIRVPSDEAPVAGERVHIVGILQQDSARLYVNGKLQSRGRRVKKYIPSPLRFVLGGNPTFEDGNPRPGVEYCFAGVVDEIHVSEVPRYGVDDFTPPDRPTPDRRTIALYHCDEGQGDRLIDASFRGNHGTIRGEPKWVPVDR